ncbi:MAG TPA: sugar ABC transporter substrate-binding protein [Gaiellaceae bacterium]|nr:sugar ABC transporter substrate-binding protein [Gaiellaceae bacterium]
MAVLALGSGCGGGSAGRGDATGSIRFVAFGDPEELKAYRDVIAAYERRQDRVDVQLVEASDRSDLIARVSTAIAGGAPPDVFLVNYRFYGQFAAKGALAPVGDRVADSDVLAEADFYPQALDAFRWRGELVCLPQNISSLVVYFNRDLFGRYGVREPSDGWTWNDMLVAATSLTRDARGRVTRAGDPDAGGATAAVYGLGVEPSVIRIAPFVWSNGGELVDDDARPTRFTLDTPEAKEALRAFLELRAPYGVVPSDVEVEAEDDEARFANGRLAMLLSSRRSTPTFRTIRDFDWDVAPLPTLRRPAGILHADAYCITKGSGKQDAAWDFVEFANSPEGQRIVARTGRTVPSLRAVAESDAFLDPATKPRSARVFLDGIPHIRRVPTISTWPEIEDASEGILENGLYLARPVDEVVAELDRTTRPLFARAETS